MGLTSVQGRRVSSRLDGQTEQIGERNLLCPSCALEDEPS